MAKIIAIIAGIIFVVAGIWGFFAPVVVWFLPADVLSSIVHVIAGIVLLVLASKPSAGAALKTIGIVYVIFAILGFIQGDTVLFGAFATSLAGNVFYAVVGVVLALVGFAGSKGSAMPSSAPMAPQM